MKRIGQGQTAEIFRQDETSILKLFREDFSEEAIQHEYDNARIVMELGVKCPRTIDMITMDHRKGIIFELVNGRTLLEEMMFKPWSIESRARQMAALHYQIHQQSGEQINQKQKSVMKNNIASAIDLLDAEKEQIMDYVNSLPEGSSLCHGDFHPNNVITGKEDYIIDWMTGTSGCPSADVARTLVLLKYGNLPKGTPMTMRILLKMIKSKMRKAYLDHYLSLSSMDIREIHRWVLPIAAARLTEWIPTEEKTDLLDYIRNQLQKFNTT
nr:aminoglycoside phosphotransferase family protein [Paenibacillus polysaccharolyticus]